MTKLKARHVTQAAKPQGRVALVALVVVAAWIIVLRVTSG